MILSDNERLEDLQCDGLKIIQNKNLYTFSSDSVILANFVKTKPNDFAVEIGAGSGVISILVQAKNKLKSITCFEIQEEMANLCKKNIELNSLQDKISLVCDDVKNFRNHIKPNSVDVVFSNPPYFKKSEEGLNKVRKIAREEICLSCNNLCETASKMLKNGGSFYVCYSAERVIELIDNLSKNGLKVKEMFFTENGKGKVKLAVIKAVKGAKDGVKVFPNLVTNEENGDYLQTLHTKYFNKKD